MKKCIPENRPDAALIYTRVSSEEQIRGFSLVSQEKRCIEYCEQMGWEAIKVFREEGESAKTADRTQLKLMQEYCLRNMGRVGYIVVWKLDRFARSQYDHLMLRKFFSGLGVELKSATEVIEDTPIGKASEGMLSIMAQYENDIKTERTIMGMRAKALDGYWPVGAPWGYRNIKDSMGKKVIAPDPEKASIVKFLFEEFVRGTIKVSDLAKKVRERNVRSKHGLKISKQLVYKILRNAIHCGKVVVRKQGISVQGKHEPIISEALFDEVQDLLDGKKGHKQVRSRDHPDFLLRGVLCDACGGTMTGGYSTGKLGKKYAYYNCLKPTCLRKGAVKRADIEDDFTELLTSITPDEGVLDALAEAIAVVYEKESRGSITHARKIDLQLKKLDEELDELMQMRLGKLVEQEEYFTQSERRKKLKKELVNQRQQLMNPETSVEADVKFGISVIKELPTVWPMLEPGELRVLKALLFPQNLRYQKPKFKTPELSPIYKLKTLNSDELNRFVTPRGIEPRFPA